jgi:antitoxin ParD1/3/4
MIERLVAQGRYQNASEVLREGLRLIEARDVVEEQKLAALRDAAKVGWDDIEAGRYRTLRTEAELHGYVAELIRSGLADPTE